MTTSVLAALAITVAAVTAPTTPETGAEGDTLGVLHFADAEGRKLTLDGQDVLYLVDFWALGCKPCMVEMPELERLAKELEPTGRFKLVTVISRGWSGPELRTFSKLTGTGLETYADPDNWEERLGINAFPTKLLIKDGRVLLRKRGGGAGAYAVWKARIDEAMKPAASTKAP